MSDNILEIKNLNFCYPQKDTLSLADINLNVKQGEILLICGRSGSGKTTLLRCLKTLLEPVGEKSGDILFKSKPLGEYSPREQAENIGFVQQSPEDQIVTDTVWHELAFGLESLGVKNKDIKLKLAEVSSFLDIGHIFQRKTASLSGGEKQIVALASVLTLKPEIIILDEPLSQLDPACAKKFISLLLRVNRELGITLMISEHITENIFPFAHRVLIMEAGRITADLPPREILKEEKSKNISLLLPTPARIYLSKPVGTPPLNCGEARNYLYNFKEFSPVEIPVFKEGEAVITASELAFSYGEEEILKSVDLKVYKNEFFAVVGQNGSGKSTLVSLLSGILKKNGGKLKTKGKVLLLPQDPRYLFAQNSLKEENLDKETVRALGIEHLLPFHPFDISGGELQKAALAKILSLSPDILIIDEPTKGVDGYSKALIGSYLKSLDITVVAVSHDLDFCGEFADRCAFLFNGEIATTAPTHEFFVKNSLYTTQASSISKDIIEGAVTAKEIIHAIGAEEESSGDIPPPPPKTEGLVKNTLSMERKKKKRLLLALPLILLFIPLVIYIGIKYFNDRKYFFISTAILLISFMPFVAVFESKSIKKRELVIIALLSALCCVGRLIFFPFPAIKPLTALVVISGVSMGAEAGFAVGAAGSLLSNFYFGQGPWTPWQMFAYGIIGFISGIFFSLTKIKKTSINLGIFGFLSVLLIYGPIMNPASVLTAQPNADMKQILASFAVGISFDMIHAVSTVIFMLSISEPIIKRLERIKIKYAIL
ncbi:MAG: ATP-binding cassette domain-containing protein [Firmicutes bacterium]|nr:ATP-binding cassette domain-containing protein [Bacillota bacterium]